MALDFIFPETTFNTLTAGSFGSLRQQGLEFGGEPLKKVASIGNSGAKLTLQGNELVANAPLEYRESAGSSASVLTKTDFDAQAFGKTVRRNEAPHTVHEFTFGGFRPLGDGARAADVYFNEASSENVVVALTEGTSLTLLHGADPIGFFSEEIDGSAGTNWTYADIDAVTVGDFNGNGRQDIAVLDTTNHKVYVYQNDDSVAGSDGLGWNSSEINITDITGDSSAGTVDIRTADLDGNGRAEIVLAHNDGLTAFRFTDPDGNGDLATTTGWDTDVLVSGIAVSALYRDLLIDVNGNGNKDDILFGGTNSTGDHGVFFITRPSTYVTSVVGTNEPPEHLERGSFVSGTSSRDIAFLQPSASDVFLYDMDENTVQVFDYSGVPVNGTGVSTLSNIARVPGTKNDGRDSLYVIAENGTDSAVFLVDYVNGTYNIPGQLTRLYRDSTDPVISHIIPYAFRDDGSTQLLEANQATQLSWYNFARTPLPRTTGTRLVQDDGAATHAGTSREAIIWTTVQFDGLDIGTGKTLTIPEGVSAIRVYAGVGLTNAAATAAVRTLRLIEDPVNPITKAESSLYVSTNTTAATISLESGLLFVEAGTQFEVQLESSEAVDYGGSAATFVEIEPIVS